MSYTPPSDLGPAGLAMWDSIIGDIAPDWELDAKDIYFLGTACHTADRAHELEMIVERDGLMIKGSKGQPVLHAAIAEARQQRVLVSALLKQVEICPPAQKPKRIERRDRPLKVVEGELRSPRNSVAAHG